MYLVDGKIPLCLHCYNTFQSIQFRKNEELERAINYFSQQMDMVVPFGPPTPKFPERRRLEIGELSMGNINVKDSSVGVLNTGHIGHIDSAISVFNQRGDGRVADAFRALVEGVAQESTLSDETKNEILEILEFLATEATQEKDRRKVTIAKPMLERLATIIATARGISQLWAQYSPILTQLFA